MCERRKIFPVLLFALLFSWGGCSRKGGDSGGASSESDVFGPVAPHLQNGLNVVVDPFAAAGIPNVVVEADAGFSEGGFSGIATVPGVHWAWPADVPASFALSENGVWKSVAAQKGEALKGPMRLRYVASLNASWERGWPAVGGGVDTNSASPVSSGVAANSGATTALSFLFVMPNDLSTPIRIWFRSGQTDIPIFHTGKSCGTNCIDFANWSEAIETPISFVSDIKNRMLVGTEAELPIEVSVKGGVNVSAGWIRSEVEAARSDLLQVWNFLVNKWGTPAVGQGYRVHLLVSSVCRSQALEHDASVIAAIGLCPASLFRKNIVSIVAHEMVHVWNGRHIFPRETAEWTPLTFDASRLNQLYFYEGATEGFSRIAVSEIVPTYRNDQMQKWNSSISQIANAGLNQSLSAISRSSPSLGYEAGAFLTLWLAAKSRGAHMVDGSDVSIAKLNFWNIMAKLKLSTSAGVFDISTALPVRKCVSNAAESFVPCAGGALGYTHDDLLQAMNSALSLPDWTTFSSAHLDDIFLANKNDLNAAISEIGASIGVSVSQSSGLNFLPSDVSAQSGIWPF